MARLPMTLIGAEGHLLTYLLTYLLQDGRSIQSLRANALGSGVVPPLNPQFWSRGQNPWGWRIFIKQLRNSNICKHKRISLWNFSPTFESRIISIVAKCCQQSTDDRRLSITLSVQLCAQYDDDWVWRNASRGPLVSTKTCHKGIQVQLFNISPSWP